MCAWSLSMIFSHLLFYIFNFIFTVNAFYTLYCLHNFSSLVSFQILPTRHPQLLLSLFLILFFFSPFSVCFCFILTCLLACSFSKERENEQRFSGADTTLRILNFTFIKLVLFSRCSVAFFSIRWMLTLCAAFIVFSFWFFRRV